MYPHTLIFAAVLSAAVPFALLRKPKKKNLPLSLKPAAAAVTVLPMPS
jgi:hypothetical protein